MSADQVFEQAQRSSGFRRIGVAAERDAPENPGDHDVRVALVPHDVATLVASGCEVSIEAGAGERAGFADRDYVAAGALIEDFDQLHRDKDLIIKLKGPSSKAIERTDPGTVMLCMVHANSFPDRVLACKARGITLIAMERIHEPKVVDPAFARVGAHLRSALHTRADAVHGLKVLILGSANELRSAVVEALRAGVKSLEVVDGYSDAVVDANSMVVHDSRTTAVDMPVLRRARRAGALVHDVSSRPMIADDARLDAWSASLREGDGEVRKIQSLEHTGRAGARYGLQLLSKESHLRLDPGSVTATVLGYGNVAFGALQELQESGVSRIRVLGRSQTKPGVITRFLHDSHLVVNGADIKAPGSDETYVLSRAHVESVLPKGSVVIDLVGGSPTNRSPVESVVSCTFMPDPHFVEHGVLISALWGWPMMGMMRESAIQYSAQITDLLIGAERLVDGFVGRSHGVMRAVLSA